MTRNRYFPLTIACFLIWALIMSKSFVQLYFGEGGKDRQVRLRQSESIIELSVDGKLWESKRLSLSDVVYVESKDNSADSLSITNRNSDSIVKMDSDDLLVKRDENEQEVVVDESVDDEQSSDERDSTDIQGEEGIKSTPSTAIPTKPTPTTSTPTTSTPTTSTPTKPSPSTAIPTTLTPSTSHPTPSTPEETVTASTSYEFSRHAVNTKPRTPYNDVLENINIKTPKVPDSVNQFYQSFSLSYYQDKSFSSSSEPTIQPCFYLFIHSTHRPTISSNT